MYRYAISGEYLNFCLSGLLNAHQAVFSWSIITMRTLPVWYLITMKTLPGMHFVAAISFFFNHLLLPICFFFFFFSLLLHVFIVH